tara:strand:- start:1105 stop:1359 length:255 start_codon:yes stop_codon:yes gene_type:complete
LGNKLSKGGLVHIPQSVTLVAHDNDVIEYHSLPIPLSVYETLKPTLGVVTDLNKQHGYIRIWCEGTQWSVSPGDIYPILEENNE